MRGGSFIGQVVSGCMLLFAVILFNFLLLHAAPGDPAEALAGATGGATLEGLTEIGNSTGSTSRCTGSSCST